MRSPRSGVDKRTEGHVVSPSTRVPRVPAHPGSSGAAASRRMRQLKRRDNGPELALRRQLHAAGLRYRVAYPMPTLARRSIDVAFPALRIAVFVDGCFWHGCPEHGNVPSANTEWWQAKLAANQARDADTTARLQELGWRVLRLWEHSVERGGAEVVIAAVRDVRPAAGSDRPGD